MSAAAQPQAPPPQQQQQNGQFQVATSTQRSPVANNIANFLFQNPILKQRTGLLNNATDIEFFRFKRFQRALLSDEYKERQRNPKNGLIPINNAQDVQNVFVLLIQNQLLLPVTKLHYAEIKEVKGWKPNKEKPTLKRADKAVMDPNTYYAWLYQKPNPFILLYSVLAIAGVFTVILFPLWPNFMKRGVWYLSMGALGLIALFFLTAIVRLIIYIISVVAFPKPLWLFPNLFEDCGVIESFQPVYAWEEPKKKKDKKSKKAATGAAPAAVAEEKVGSEKPKATGSEVANGDGDATAGKRKVTLEEVDE
ncbi:Translocation protein SEC62 [Candida viswanathii]|uniref:Translocation protein SEC62 n=1 Tax=Candida viswanathii TaxID=5486 RepID=A0A367Y604_9ASCO|nr:Translocation protein SEC62 [Candida viswanathii]